MSAQVFKEHTFCLSCCFDTMTRTSAPTLDHKVSFRMEVVLGMVEHKDEERNIWVNHDFVGNPVSALNYQMLDFFYVRE